MKSLQEISAPVDQPLKEFSAGFSEVFKSKIPLLNIVLRYIVKQKGKQMRPMFVFLCAGATGNINLKTHRAAALIELLHTATLVHDDVVDNAYERRGFFSINALWKNKIAVLAGDYLLAKGLLQSVHNDDFDLLKIVAEATNEMSEGELLQIEKARRLDITEDVYFEIIRKKTASLIASCCACGAASSGNDHSMINHMLLFGTKAGIAFQIKDDLFDYQLDNKTGKPAGGDLKERKMTLPLIYTLQHASRKDKQYITHSLKKHSGDKKNAEKVIALVKEAGGLEYARKKMYDYREEALVLLHELPDSTYRQSLEDLLIFTTERTK
ncbi:MAG: polyprenyl synthetase family protein [Bacteroidales bacterium]|nr:polyprenyl synthetase family protein [Bacteroidales bacterium]